MSRHAQTGIQSRGAPNESSAAYTKFGQVPQVYAVLVDEVHEHSPSATVPVYSDHWPTDRLQWQIEAGEPCLIIVFRKSLAEERPDGYQEIIAHELLHCFQ